MTNGRYVDFKLDISENGLTEIYSRYFDKFIDKIKKEVGAVEYFELDKLNAAVLFYIAQSKLFEKYSKEESYLNYFEEIDGDEGQLFDYFSSSEFKLFYFKNKEDLFLNVLEKAKFYLEHEIDFRTKYQKDFSEYFISICENLATDNSMENIFSPLFKKSLNKLGKVIATILVFYGELKYDEELIYESKTFFELKFAKLILYFSMLFNQKKDGDQSISFSSKIMVKFVSELMNPRNIFNKKKVYAPITDYGSFFVYFLEELFKNSNSSHQQIKNVEICPQSKTTFIRSLCSMILFLLKIDTEKLQDNNFIGDPIEIDHIPEEEKFDYIFAYIPTEKKSWISETDFLLGDFATTPSRDLPVYAWLIKIINRFSENSDGTCAIIFPYGSGSVKQMQENRKIFVEKNLIDAIIKLPKGDYFNLSEEKLLFILKGKRETKQIFVSDLEYFLKYSEKVEEFFDIMDKIKDSYITWTTNPEDFNKKPGRDKYGTIIDYELLKMNDANSFRMEIFFKQLEAKRIFFDQEDRLHNILFDHYMDKALFEKYVDEMGDIINLLKDK